jgi:alkaline phosphatase D
MAINRRLLLKGMTLGAGLLALPAWAQVASQGFTHDVASGEPGHDRVMLWTRYVPAPGIAGRLRWEVSRDAGFGAIVAEGDAEALPERDWCVTPVAAGLAPGGWYYYRFRDGSGRSSPVGRTRTLPDGPVGRFGIGLFSCSNLPFGYFNAYAHAAARDDLDLMVHVGDYLYEYPQGQYPVTPNVLPGREVWPAHETLALADYRLRYAAYRSDPDLQRLHRLFPMIVMWDDHESANNAWQGGAQNHQPEIEGGWNVRKAAAMQACREWLPVSDSDWTSYRIGDLADLFRPETRFSGRTEQLDIAAFVRGRTDRERALAEFRDGPWRSETSSILGAEQEAWLAQGLRRSTADGVKWQVLCQQVIMGSLSMPPAIAAAGSANTSGAARARMDLLAAASKAGLPLNLDIWDGYPAARERLLKGSLEADANLVVLSGDSHNAWAFDLALERDVAGVDLAVHSVTSPGYENSLAMPAGEAARAFVEHNPQLAWAETSRRGYLSLELTPERATGEWHFLDTVRQPSLTLAGSHRMTVERGRNRFT